MAKTNKFGEKMQSERDALDWACDNLFDISVQIHEGEILTHEDLVRAVEVVMKKSKKMFDKT